MGAWLPNDISPMTKSGFQSSTLSTLAIMPSLRTTNDVLELDFNLGI
jgi:hypothetical protein